jgi:5-methylcytosine-specific restriction enzyme A
VPQLAKRGIKVRLEEELDQALRDGYHRTRLETGYKEGYFWRDLLHTGALATAQRLLRPAKSQKTSPGLQKLIDSGRLDLSLESIVLNPRFHSLFTDAELGEARRRLESLRAYLRPRSAPVDENFIGELDDDLTYVEGAVQQVTVNKYERDGAARDACIAKHGKRCAVCDMSFGERYGEIGKDFIYVHHKKPLATRRQEYEFKATVDLAPVCPNCHAMLHASDPPLGIDRLRDILRAQNERAQ